MKSLENIVASTEIRPWGSFKILDRSDRYLVKVVEINPGHRTSYKLHHHKSITFNILAGAIKLTIEDDETILTKDKCVVIEPCTRYRLANCGVIKASILDITTGEYVGEDDVIRFADDYARS